MRVGVVAVAAVRIGRVAVRLDDGWVCWRALEATWASSELHLLVTLVRVYLERRHDLPLEPGKFQHCTTTQQHNAGHP